MEEAAAIAESLQTAAAEADAEPEIVELLAARGSNDEKLSPPADAKEAAYRRYQARVNLFQIFFVLKAVVILRRVRALIAVRRHYRICSSLHRILKTTLETENLSPKIAVHQP